MNIKPGSKASRYISMALLRWARDLELDCEFLPSGDGKADTGNDLGYVRSLIRGFEAEMDDAVNLARSEGLDPDRLWPELDPIKSNQS